MKHREQERIKTCEKCRPFKKYGTLRGEEKGEAVCSVCGTTIK